MHFTANKTMPGAYEMLKNSADVFLYPVMSMRLPEMH